VAPCAESHLPSVSIARSIAAPFVGWDIMSVTDGTHVGAACGSELDHTNICIHTVYINTNTYTYM
jgi:hypothetical protein